MGARKPVGAYAPGVLKAPIEIEAAVALDEVSFERRWSTMQFF